MLGPAPDGPGAVPHDLPVRAHPRSVRARRCRRRRATSSTRSAIIDESGADALRFALIHGATPGHDQRFGDGQARERPELRQQALERDPVRRRRSGRPRSPRAPSAACPTPATSARRSAGCCRGPRRRPPRSTRRWPHYAFGEVTRLAVRRDLERVLRLGRGAGQGPARRRVRCRPTCARPPGGPSSRCSTRTCACSIR